MIEEAHVSFEVAKLLKEKGFNEKCRGGYHYEFDNNDNPIVMLEEWTAQPYNNDFVDEGFLCSAPTHQMAMAWLRTKHIIIVVQPEYFSVDGTCHFWGVDIWADDNYEKLQGDYPEYEKAVEASLKYVLENLI